MTARGAGILSSVLFILLLSFGSYLLDVPMPTVIVAAIFAISVILWVGTRDTAKGAPSSRSFTAGASEVSEASPGTGAGDDAATRKLSHLDAAGTAPDSGPARQS